MRYRHKSLWLLPITCSLILLPVRLVLAQTTATPSDSSALSAKSVQLKPYQAQYRYSYKGIGLSGERSLKQLDDGRYQVISNSEWMFIAIKEQAKFSLSNDAVVTPEAYSYKRQGLNNKRDMKLVYDWDKKEVSNALDNRPWKRQLQSEQHDPLSHQIQLRLMFMQQPPVKDQVIQFPVITLKRNRTFTYKVLGDELLQTELGELETIKLVQTDRPDATRSTFIWLAPKLDYLITKLQYNEKDGSSYSMLIKQLKWR